MKRIVRFFDRIEDKTRERLSTVPIVYAIIGGITVVIFWRGVWEIADHLEQLGGFWAFIFDPTVSVILSIVTLLFTGLFVSFFIGDRIILSGLKHEKKVEEKTELEVREEETMIIIINKKLDHLRADIEELKSAIKNR
jgi:hypothetical protein